MAIYQVICKEKHSLYERITAIGCIDDAIGTRRRFLEDDAIKRIESGTDKFYVKDNKGNRAWVEVKEREGRKYLTTHRDGIWDDNLLSLPDCPAQKSTSSSTARTVAAAVGSHGVPFKNYWGA